MTNPDIKKCYIFGDESGNLGIDRFFSIGIIGARDYEKVVEKLRDFRKRANFFGEMSYKSNDRRRALCAIRWIDWFFSGQDLANFKIIIKDKDEFKVNFFKDNKYKTKAWELAYCESYKEVIGNFADYNNDKKVLIYSQIGLAKMKVEEYLNGKIYGLSQNNCFSRHPTDKRRKVNEYTKTAEMLQLCDLLTGATRGLCCSIYGEETSEDWVKNMMRKNIHYHIPQIKNLLLENKNVYFPTYEPYNKQIFVVYKWRNIKSQNTPIR